MSSGNPFGSAGGGSLGTDVVTLEMPGRDLGNFLASMLGQRRQLSKVFEHRFVARLDWLINLSDLINQRVVSQNRGQLIGFKAEFLYDSGKKVEVSQIEHFKTYNDVSDDKSIGCRLHFMYLLDFPLRDGPERQDIILNLSTESKTKSKNSTRASSLRSLLIPLEEDNSEIRLDLRITDLSWGEDIINLVSNQISASFQKRNGMLDKVRVLFAGVLPVIAMSSALFTVVYLELSSSNIKRNFLVDNQELFSTASGSTQAIEEKLNFIFRYNLVAESSRPLGLYMFTSIVPMIVIALIYMILHLKRSSFVILNSATERYHSEREKRFNFLFNLAVAGIILSIVVGLVTNAIYARLPSL